MKKPETKRLECLRQCGVLDTPNDSAYDEIVELAHILTGVPIALISLVDEKRQWFKARRGLNVQETPRDVSFCQHVLNEPEIMIVPDAALDPRFRENALVLSDPKIRFYAGVPLRMPSGDVLGTLCVIDRVPRELTSLQIVGLKTLARTVVSLLELRRTQVALKEKELLLKSFFDSCALGMGVAEIRGDDIVYLSENSALCRYFSRPEGEVSGSTASALGVPPERIRALVETYRRSRDSGVPEHLEYSRRIANEDSFYRLTVNFIQDGAETSNRFSFVLEDVTEKIRYDKQVHEEREKLQMIAANIGDVIWMTNPDKCSMNYVSPAYEKIWEQTCSSLYADPQGFVDAIHPEDRPRVLAAMVDQISGKYNEIYRICMPDGRIKWIQDRCFPIRQTDGSVTHVVGLATDITARQESERLIADQRASIVHASRLAAVGEMAAGVAHEINNPLAIIRGNAQLLLRALDFKAGDPGSIRESAQRIDQTVQRVAKIVRGLRTFARDGANDPPARTSLKEIILDSLEFCKTRFKNNDVPLEVKVPDEDIVIACQAVQISQVLLNLLSNALDATLSEDSAWVRIQLSEDAEFAYMRVSNGGPPIPENIRLRMMEPFFTTKAPGQGTGLGLSISKGIVESHGGTLTLDLDEPHTCFRVTLPKNRIAKRAA